MSVNDYMMDVEQGICHQTTREEKHGFATISSPGPSTSKLLTALSIFISTVALVGVVIVVLQYRELQAEMQQDSTNTQTERMQRETDTRKIRALLQEHIRSGRDTATTTSYSCPHESWTPPYYKDCYDSPGSIPSAHIVPDGMKSLCSVADPPLYYANISSGWSCGSKIDAIFLPGYVRGGMVFDRDEGKLIVPIEGIYFVYSQVHISSGNTSDIVLLGTQTLICEEDRCRDTSYMLSRGLTEEGYGPFYHGGLFHLNANSTIKLAAFGKVNESYIGTLAYATYFANTFMGAYLVEAIEKENPTIPDPPHNSPSQTPIPHTPTTSNSPPPTTPYSPPPRRQ